jgi:SAM-dependent methyltransferase
MEISTFRKLLTIKGQDVLASAVALDPTEDQFLPLFDQLCKEYPRELARAALETAILRKEAAKKFPQADKMYFTREALEQATSHEVSAYRAERFKNFKNVVDMGCSIGSDSFHLAKNSKVTGLDLDLLRVEMAAANARALGIPATFLLQDIVFCALPHSDAAFFDPARRSDQRRIFSVRDYVPPLSIIKKVLPQIPNLGVKLSPGVKLEEIAEYDCEVEFISLKGDLKEAVLWFGEMKKQERSAAVLPGPHILTEADPVPVLEIGEPAAYIYEPDPAVMRAGLVTTLGAQLNAHMLDPEIAFLTNDEKIKTPFARVWQVLDWMPFQLKRLRAYLRENDIGRVTVKKRGSPILPEELIQQLRLKGGGQERVLFMTQMSGKPIVVITIPA